MSDSTSRISPEVLLAHHQWVRRLVQWLVMNADDAADVEQETWRQALERPPRHTDNPRPWLGTVARNVARKLGRDRRAQEIRELAAAAPPDGLQSSAAAEVAERVELHRRVVDQVLALDELYRVPLLLRYFDDLPAAQVAQNLGVPVETARTRIKRGLTLLRDRLEQRFALEHRDWVKALTPLLILGTRHSPGAPNTMTPSAENSVGGNSMSTFVKSLVPMFIIGLATVSSYTLWSGASQPGSDPANGSAAGGSAGHSRQETVSLAPRHLNTQPSASRTAAASVTGPAPDSSALPAGSILRVVTESGDPVAQALLIDLGPGMKGTTHTAVFRELGVTAANGQLEVDLAKGRYVMSMLDQRCSAIHWFTGESSLTMILPKARAPVVGIRDSVGTTPLGGISLRFLQIDHVPPVALLNQTLADGTTSRPIPPGRYRLECGGQRVLGFRTEKAVAAAPMAAHGTIQMVVAEDETSPDPDDLPRSRPGEIYVDLPRSLATKWVEVESGACLQLDVLDAETHEPIENATLSMESFFADRGAWFFMDLLHPNSIRQKQFSPYQVGARLFYPTQRIKEQTEPGDLTPQRIRVWAPGYLPATVNEPASISMDHPMQVYLDRAENRWLVVKDRKQRVPAGVFQLIEDNGAQHFVGELPEDGRVGPFGWCGGSTRVVRARQLVGQVDARQWREQEQAELTLSVSGSIVVEIPPAMNVLIECRSETDQSLPGHRDQDRIVFENLAAGTYRVGPRYWVERDVGELFSEDPIGSWALADGQRLQIPWHDAWTSATNYQGSVIVAAGLKPDELEAAPLFHDDDLQWHHRWKSRMVPVNSNGQFAWDRLSLVPRGAVITTRVNGEPRALAITETWEGVVVGVGTLELSVIAKDPVIEVQVQLAARTATTLGFLPSFDAYSEGNSIRVPMVPTQIDQLLIHVNGQVIERSVQIRAGEVSSVTINLE